MRHSSFVEWHILLPKLQEKRRATVWNRDTPDNIQR